MPTNYPGSLDAWNNPGPSDVEDSVAFPHDVLHANHNDAIEAIEGELGVNPSGTFSTVSSRMDSMDTLRSAAWQFPTSIGSPTFSDEFLGSSLDPGWVRVDYSGHAGHVVYTVANENLVARHGSTSCGASGRIHGLVRPVITTPSIGDAVVICYSLTSEISTYCVVGVGYTNGTVHGTSTAIQGINYPENNNYGTVTTLTANVGMITNTQSAGTWYIPSMSPKYMRLVMTGTTSWRNDYSLDGMNWVTVASTMSYTMPSAVTHMGMFFSNWNSTKTFVVNIHSFRRYSGVS